LEVSERTVEFHVGEASQELEAWKHTLMDLLGVRVAPASPGPAVSLEEMVEAVDTMLKKRHIRARDLIQDPRYNPSKEKVLDAYGLQQVCAEAGLSLSLADSSQLIQSISASGHDKVDLGELEAVLRSRRRVRTAEDVEKEAMRARASLRLLKQKALAPQPTADERLQGKLDEPVERARVRIRAASFGRGGVKWAQAFMHYDPQRAGLVDARGFAAMVRHEVKIPVREMPDAVLGKVFAHLDKSGLGTINYKQLLAWIGLQEDAHRELREERAAARIQALHRGRKARRRVSAMKERAPRKLRHGSFKVRSQDGRVEVNTLFIYEDRLEFFSRNHGHRVMAGDIEDVEVLDRGFVLSLRGGNTFRLTPRTSICMEEWLEAFSRVCEQKPNEDEAPETQTNASDFPWSSDGEVGEDPGESQASYASTAASAAGVTRGKAAGGGRQEKSTPPANVIWFAGNGGPAAGEAAPERQRSASPRGRQGPGSPRGAAQQKPSPRGPADDVRQSSPRFATADAKPAPGTPRGGQGSPRGGPQPGTPRGGPAKQAGQHTPRHVPVDATPTPGNPRGGQQPGPAKQAGQRTPPDAAPAQGNPKGSQQPGPGRHAGPNGPKGGCQPATTTGGRQQGGREAAGGAQNLDASRSASQGGGRPGPGFGSASSVPPGAGSSRNRSCSPGRARTPRRLPSPPRKQGFTSLQRAENERAHARTEEFLYAGVLGYEDCGVIVQRYTTLFKDRLDSWDNPRQAATGQPPRGRVALCDVRRIEMVRGGFVLKCKGRKVELFVADPSHMVAWSGALHSVVNTQYEPRPERARSPRSKSWMPRVATLQPAAHQFAPGPPPPVTLCTCRLPSRDGVRINTHGGGLQANTLLLGKEAMALNPGQKGVSGKVNERASPLRTRPQPTEKVTGRLHLTPRKDYDVVAAKITGDRQFSPRAEQLLPAKVGERDRSRSPDRSPERRCHGMPTTVTDVGRQPAARLRSASPPMADKITGSVDRLRCGSPRSVSPPIAEKVTGASDRVRYGSPRSRVASDRDMTRTLGVSSSHHKTGVSWAWGAG